ncbi:UDP-2,3-diacylglucosamine diphosphatase LpxI [Hyphomonadaceae bacterium ML37]|nr:UDP-2,3-diacylglucosamine diphosphatase LpxI [Hyphomonadaceae bacterium ML37]
MAGAWTRLGLIAGGGELPVHVAEAARADGRLATVVALKGFADPARFEGAKTRGLGELGGVMKDLAQARCDAVCFAGIVSRPDFSQIKPDFKGISVLPKMIAAAARGDDALLRTVIGVFEAEGLAVVGADEIARELTAREGYLGAQRPDEAQRRDALRALHIAGVIGAEDVGQGAVVCDGLVLAVEAQEGTDAMLRRVADLPATLRGTPQQRRGVLAKRPKPGQERRIDLPVIGVSTVEGAACAGLAGIAAPAGGALILGAEAVARAAEDAGLFVWIVNDAASGDGAVGDG